ncbi:UNVERIFIED_ORG: hypothetical protein J2X79_001986 [Arthrobacter globiformis]|nr:hypothetical protein [Arthrobacter globiformis]
MHLKNVASPQTIRKYFPNGIPEIASEAVRHLAASGSPNEDINRHLEALASSFLNGSPETTRTVLISLRLARIPSNPLTWSAQVHDEVRGLLENINDPTLHPVERARLNFLAAQHETKLTWDRLYPNAHSRRFPTPPPKELQAGDRTAHFLENARDLYLRSDEHQGALLAHIELRNHRIFNIVGDPDLNDIHALYRDCIAMRGTDLHVAAAVWIRLQEALHARTLGFSEATIQEIFIDALSGFRAAPAQDFRTYPMDEIRKTFLMASQVGEVTEELADSIPMEAIYAIGVSWLSTIPGQPHAPRGDTLSPASLILLRNGGIAQTYARTREFRLLLQTNLGLTVPAVEDVFDKFGLERFQPSNDSIFSGPSESEKALDQLVEAVRRVNATPQLRQSWIVEDVIKDLRILQDDWEVTGKHRSPFESKVTIPLTGEEANSSLAHWLWTKRTIEAATNAAQGDDGIIGPQRDPRQGFVLSRGLQAPSS